MNYKILILLIVSSIQVFAGVSGEIFTTGYHELVVDTLNAVGGLASSNNEPLIKIATAIALLIMTIKIIFNQNSRQVAGFEFLKMGTFVLAIQALFISAPNDDNHAYAVIDRISLETTEVRQIPKGIGEFLSLFTTLEDGIMQKMELYFTTPDSLSYRQAGLGFTVSTQMEIMKADIASTFLKKTFYDYFLNCKIDGDFSNDEQGIQEILSAEGVNLITKLGTDRTNLTLVYSDNNPEGVVMSCKSAWDSIKTSLGTESYNHQAAYAKARGLFSQTYGNKIAMSNLITGSTSATVSARDQLESAIARNATVDAIKKVASFNGVSDSLLTKQLSISEISMTNSSILSNYQAQSTIPILKALCTAFIIVISWLIAILAIATMNFQYIKFIVVLNIWLMLWSPLFQLLNYAIDIMVSNALSLYGDGINSYNQVGVYEILGGKLAIVTNLVWSIPILAFGIAKGGEMAMSQFIGGMVAPVQQAAHHTTKTDLQSALGKSDGYTDHNGNSGTFGVSNRGEEITGRGGQSTHMSPSGNTSTAIASTDSTTVKSASNSNVSATIAGDKISTHNDDASATVTSAASTALTNADNNVKSFVSSLSSENSNTANNVATVGSGSTLTNTNGDSVKLSNGTTETLQAVSATANKEAFGSTSKNGLSSSISSDKNAQTILSINENTSAEGIGKAFAAATGLSATLTAQGNVKIGKTDGTSFEISKDSSYGKEFTQNYSKSVANQMSNSKDNTQAVANMTSAVNGESQSDSNSTAYKVANAYSEQESASKTFQATKQVGTSQGDNLTNSAFQNFFAKNSDVWGSASNEQKADFMVNKMVGWNQSMEGIKDRTNFIDDNISKPELKNDVNTKSNIENKGQELSGNVNEHVKGKVKFDSNSNADVISTINNEGEKIKNTDVRNPNIDNGVNSNVKKEGEVEKDVNSSSDKKGKVIEGAAFVGNEKINNSMMINATEGVEKVPEVVKDVFKSLSGHHEVSDPAVQQYAENNKSMNSAIYEKSKGGDNGLIKEGWIKDDINVGKMKDSNTEDLAKIYQHNNTKNSLSEDSSKILNNELKSRGYDLNNPEFSSNYKPETIKAPSIIPNGDAPDPTSSKESKNKSDFPRDFKPSY